MWKWGDFSIKLSLEKGDSDSNENMELKYGRKIEKQVSTQHPEKQPGKLTKWGNSNFCISI